MKVNFLGNLGVFCSIADSAKIFVENGALKKLQKFTSKNGASFMNLRLSNDWT